MFSWSRRLFAVYLFLVLTGISGILFYSFMSFFLTNFAGAALWMNIIIFFAGAFVVLIYFSDRISSVLKILLTLVLFSGSFFSVQYFIKLILPFLHIPVFSDIQLLLVVFGLYMIQRAYLNSIKRGFDRLYSILECESSFTSQEKFRGWAEGRIDVRNEKIEPVWFVKLITNTAFILLIVSFISVAKNPETRWFQSLFLLCLGFGGFGVYLVLFQLSSVLQWKLLGYGIKGAIIKNWNRIISILPVFLIIVSLAIPWNFSVFSSVWLTKALNKIFLLLSINLSQPGSSVANITPSPAVDSSVDKLSGEIWNTGQLFIKYLLLAFAAYIALYLIASVIGLVLLIIFRNKKRPAWVSFFIKRFMRISGFVNIAAAAVIFLLNFILTMFGFGKINRKKDLEKTRKIEKQLLSFFEKYVKLTNEKLDEIKIIIKDFIRLIEAASRSVTPYYLHYGPREYMDMLKEYLPGNIGELSKITDIFNESRYSLHLLLEIKKKEFTLSIDKVLEDIDEFARRNKK